MEKLSLRRRLKAAAPSLCLVISAVLLTALASSKGRGYFISRFDSIPAEAPVSDIESVSSRSVAENAGSIASRFGVTVLYMEDASIMPYSYSCMPVYDEALVLSSLEEIEHALSHCPDGFIKKLASGFPGGIIIELCGDITASSGDLIDLPSAITFDSEGAKFVALDITSGSSLLPTVVHELCHITDARLYELAKADPSRWNDADWERLNPEGFRYYGAYTDKNGVPLYISGDASYTAEAEPENAWFINRYAKTSSSEDRAELFEALARFGPNALIMQSPHIKAKLEYCLSAVEYYFGTGENQPIL